MADKILIELNEAHEDHLTGMHDIYLPDMPPHRREIPVYRVNDRIGTISIQADPRKVAGVVRTCERDAIAPFTPTKRNDSSDRTQCGRLSGSGMEKRSHPPRIPSTSVRSGQHRQCRTGSAWSRQAAPPFSMFTEVIQNSVIDLMLDGRICFATGSSLTLSDDKLDLLYDNMDTLGKRILLRPQEITNHPETIRRLGVIAINTTLEADIFGNVNSTHVLGRQIMNGIGGSGDFARNAYLSIFTTPSTAKGGLISSIVPQVSHTDSTEHDVRILITEQGVADLRGKSPRQRAECIIENCAHPDYRQLLWDYVKLSDGTSCHTPLSLRNALKMHLAFAETGDMRNTVFE